MESDQNKKSRGNYYPCHTALLGTLTAIHSLKTSFPDTLDFWNGRILLQYHEAQQALTILGQSLYESLAQSVYMMDAPKKGPVSGPKKE